MEEGADKGHVGLLGNVEKKLQLKLEAALI